MRGVTLTVTEAAYVRAADGGLDRDRPEIRADAAALRGDPAAPVQPVYHRCNQGEPGAAGAGAQPAQAQHHASLELRDDADARPEHQQAQSHERDQDVDDGQFLLR
jgi:hypothetical protein